MSDIRDMLRKGQVKLGPEASVKIDGKLVRSDGTRHTVPTIQARRNARRKVARQARQARRRNR